MQTERKNQLLRIFRTHKDWFSAAELADSLGVSERTVRTYIRELNAAKANQGVPLIESSRNGYRLNRKEFSENLADEVDPNLTPTGPLERLYYIVRLLITRGDQIDIFTMAQELYVSEATIESDLTRARALLQQFNLSITRNRDLLQIHGTEVDRRKLIRQILYETSRRKRLIDLRDIGLNCNIPNPSEFKSDVINILAKYDLSVNEYTVNNLILHLAIIIERIRSGNPLAPDISDTAESSAPGAEITGAVAELTHYLQEHFDLKISGGDRLELGYLLEVKTTLQLGTARKVIPQVVNKYVEVVQRVMAELNANYLLDIDDIDFVHNLALHLRNMVLRAEDERPVRNPLGTSIKTSHPLIHELAVYFAKGLEKTLGMKIADDEIAFIALHIGAFLESSKAQADLVPLTLIVPRYYGLPETILQRINKIVSGLAYVAEVITTLDYPGESIHTPLVISTIEIPLSNEIDYVLIGPLLGADDQEKILQAVREYRSSARRKETKNHLLRLLDPRGFFRDQVPQSQLEILQFLTENMCRNGVVDENFFAEVMEREKMSSTAFHNCVAVPHSMQLNAKQTAISILVSETPLDWAGTPVNLVALIAFNSSERHIFTEIFDQLIAVIAEPSNVRRLVKKGVSYESFIEEITTILD